jgi:hypothetical protein
MVRQGKKLKDWQIQDLVFYFLSFKFGIVSVGARSSLQLGINKLTGRKI